MTEKKDLENKCIWYEVDCKKAMPQKHKYCSGIPETSCFAYLSNKMIKEREKDKQLELKLDYQI